MIIILKNVLALDSICPYLKFYERMQVHGAILTELRKPKELCKGINTEVLPLRVRQGIELIKRHKWEAPERRHFEDRLKLHYYDEDLEKWQPIEKYKHEILTEINTIK
ncbi:MAG: hypothetical protein KGV59_07605 [Tenacibaculum sp.]|nr:hypothetical protein [Tenacibaculum sp.]